MTRIQASQIPSDAIIVDVRDDLEVAAKPLEGRVLRLSVPELEEDDLELPNAPLVVVCSVGARAEYAAALLESLGALNVYVLEGGAKVLLNLVQQANFEP
jgi:sulfur-carrier protein adenylyltransferase/sulfurtransferase